MLDTHGVHVNKVKILFGRSVLSNGDVQMVLVTYTK